MKDTHWVQNPKMIEVNHNDNSDALCTLFDLKSALSKTIKNKPLNSSDFTIGDALDHVIEFIATLDQKLMDTTP